MLKNCEFCGKIYPAIRANQKFCSVQCKILNHRGGLKKYTSRVCAQCATEYIPIRIDQRFCSVRCHDLFYSSHQEKELLCPICGKRYTTTTLKRKFCSAECAKKAKANRDKGRVR